MRASEVAIGAALTALGLAFAVGTRLLPEAAGYSTVGPGVFPGIVAGGLVLVGLSLLAQALAGGLRARAEPEGDPFDARAFAWTSGGLLAHLALIGTIGFVAASTLLFVAIARGFGSRRPLRDVVVAVVLSGVLYALFTEVLGLALGPSFASLSGRG